MSPWGTRDSFPSTFSLVFPNVCHNAGINPSSILFSLVIPVGVWVAFELVNQHAMERLLRDFLA